MIADGGVLIRDFGAFPMWSRDDLDDPALQAALRARHGRPEHIICLCGLRRGLELRMKAVEIDGRMRVDRYSVDDDHDAHCIFCLPSDFEERHRARQTIAMFDATPTEGETGMIGPGSYGHEWFGGHGRQNTPLVTYAHSMLARGYTVAFAETNRLAMTCGAVRRPHAKLIFQEIDASLRKRVLEGRDGYTGARAYGCELLFGILPHELPERCDVEPAALEVPLMLLAWSGGVLKSRHVRCRSGVVARCRRKVSIFENLVPPPYVFIAVVEPDDRVRHLVIHPVLYDGVDLAFARSRGEQGYRAYLRDKGCAFYAPFAGMEEYVALVTDRLQPVRCCGRKWPFKPDILRFDHSSIHVTEERGFRPGRFPIYDALFARKGPGYREFLAGGQAEYCETKSWKFHDYPLARPPELGGERVPRGFWLRSA